MNNKHFFFTLAFQNIKKNGKFYFPYLLTFIGTVAVYYIMSAIAVNKGICKLPGSTSMTIILEMGSVVIGIFAFIFLFYTNSFLVKKRKKEFGLYSILGMEKRHVAKVLFLESFITAAAGIAGGLVVGIVFNKLLLMILVKIIKVEIVIQFAIEGSAMVKSCILFGIIFICTFIYNEMVMLRTKTVDLLKSEKVGEREPKTKWFSAIFGVACIVAAYYIAITTKNPIAALNQFFFAVILVIAGTYALFSAGSIALLKMLRKNKKYYYQTKHFTAVSGMIYRMKQNAAGLASICILSTMVLVMVSTTICLYAGVENALKTRFPYSFEIQKENPKESFDEQEFAAKVMETVEQTCEVTEYGTMYKYNIMGTMKDGQFDFDNTMYMSNLNQFHSLQLYTLDYYNKMTGDNKTLAAGEMLAYDTNLATPKQFSVYNQEFCVKEYVDNFLGEGYDDTEDMNVHYLVVSDKTVLYDLYKEVTKNTKSDNIANYVNYTVGVEVKGSNKDQVAIFEKLAAMKQVSVESRENERSGFFAMYGGLLFLGMFLGTVFIMATGLIIYYKQISEGYEDKERYEIMQKVGMSKKEIKQSIRSQVLLVFFLPLVTAGIHTIAAFPIVKKLLFLLNLSDTSPFIWCLAGTIAVFAIVYGVVYSMTSKVYYRIVE